MNYLEENGFTEEEVERIEEATQLFVEAREAESEKVKEKLRLQATSIMRDVFDGDR